MPSKHKKGKKSAGGTYRRRVLVAEQLNDSELAVSGQRKPQEYRRRDMKAKT